MEDLGIVALLERVSRSLPSTGLSAGDVAPAQFRSPDLLLRSASRESAEGFALSDDGAVARALFGDEPPGSPPRSPAAERSAAVPPPPPGELLVHLHRAAREGRPALLRFTYSVVLGLLARGDLRVPAPLAARTRSLLLGALADLAPVASGMSARIAGSLVGLEKLAGSGSGTSAQWDAACRARVDDARLGGAGEGEDADIRVLLASTMRAVSAAAPALRAPAVPNDISLPFSPEHESKLHAHTPADRAAHGAREALRDRILGIMRGYRDIGSSFSAATWPEFLHALPAAAAALRPLLLPSNAAWFARLLLGELELFHAHELLGGPAVASDARLLACDRSDGRLQQLAERLAGGAAWGGQPSMADDAAPADAAPTATGAALRELFESVAKGGVLQAEEREPRRPASTHPRAPQPRPPAWGSPGAVAPMSASTTTPATGPDLLQQRVQGSWSHGPPKIPGGAAPAAPGLGARPAAKVNHAASAAPPSQQQQQLLPQGSPQGAPVDAQRPRSRREPLQDGSLRASAPVSASSRGGSRDAAAAAAAARVEGQSLAASIAVADALRLRGACRFFVLVVLLLDNLHVTAALRLRISAELRRSAHAADVFSMLVERCERSLLPHAHRSRAHAQVLAALDLAPLIVAAQSAFRSDAVATFDDFRGAPLSVDCAACLRAAAADECLAAVVPWVSQFVATAAYSVPLGLHDGLRSAHELLVCIASEAQLRLLPHKGPPAAEEDTKLAGDRTCLVGRISPCVAVAIVATVEDLCSNPAVAAIAVPVPFGVASRIESQPTLPRAVLNADGGEDGTARIDSSHALIGHRFLVEACPSLRPLHELVRQRAAAAASLSAGVAGVFRGLSSQTPPPPLAAPSPAIVFSTPSKSRPLLTVAESPLASLEVSSAGAPQLPSFEELSDALHSPAAPPARTPAILPRVHSFDSAAGSSCPPLLSSARRQVSAPSARKIQPTLLSGPYVSTSSIAGAGSRSGALIRIGPGGVQQNRADVDVGGSVAEVEGVVAGSAGGPLMDPGFRAELSERFFRLHPHFRRLVQSLAEAAAVGALRHARAAASRVAESRQPPAASQGEAADVSSSALASEALRLAALRAAAAARCLFSFVEGANAVDTLPVPPSQAALDASQPAPLADEAELGAVVSRLCVQEAHARVLQLVRLEPGIVY